MASTSSEYNIIRKFGSDDDNNFGTLYLVEKEEKGEKKAYMKKVLKESKEDEIGSQKLFDIEIDIINKLANCKDNIYTPIIYAYKKYNIPDNKINQKPGENKEKIQNEFSNSEERPFYIIDFFSKGNLFYYTKFGKLLEQKHSKLLFKKIAEGFRFIHNQKICHLDIKLENIVFDKNFEPIIIDFGYSMELEELDGKILPFKGSRGSKLYESPEMLENKEYNGIQSDIFSLGVILFNIVSGSYGFKSSRTDDKYYKFIVNNKDEYKDYWKLVEQTVNMKFSENFKKLYVKMIAYNPSDRIKSIDEILNDPWFQDINDEQDKDKLELEYKENISKICENIKIEENKELIVSDEIIKEGYNTRCDDDDKKRAFSNEKIEAKKIPNDLILVNHFIKIKGNIPELDFMNDLYDEIIENLNGFCKESKESLKFEVTFEETEERGICKMDIELFKYEEGRYLLEFLRTRGEIQDYYHYFSEIKELLKKNEE